MSANLRLEGLEELNRALLLLPDKIARRAVIGGLREGAKVIKKAGVLAAPVRASTGDSTAKFIGDKYGIRFPGFLRRTTVYRTVSNKRADRPTIHVGPRRAAFYGQFFEIGRAGPRRMPHRAWFSMAYRARNRAALAAIGAGLWKHTLKEMKKYGI